MKTIRQVIAKIRLTIFVWRLDGEIYNRLFPHLEGESNEGYPFTTDEQMNAQSDPLELCKSLALLYKQSDKMPKAYGEGFRYLVHRDLSARIRRYLNVAQRRIPQSARVPSLTA